jgi:hypothetical protein
MELAAKSSQNGRISICRVVEEGGIASRPAPRKHIVKPLRCLSPASRWLVDWLVGWLVRKSFELRGQKQPTQLRGLVPSRNTPFCPTEFQGHHSM